MTQRYATIITGDDGQEIVSAIGEFEGAAPRPRLGRVELVAPGVLIGMVRDAAGGFCFPQTGLAGHSVGLAMASLKARVAKSAVATTPKGAGKTSKARKKPARSKKRTRQARPAAKAGMAVACANAMGQDHG
ncbi:hypothetical protein [Mesorhizobium sp. M0488]|uniref:hypothetical protein n=1 Tax=unclassified Mesorhizobium TaxID=325217 RepID=UPI003336CFBB